MNQFQRFALGFIPTYLVLRLLAWVFDSVELTVTAPDKTVIPFWTKFSWPGGPVLVTLRRYTVRGTTARIKVVRRPW